MIDITVGELTNACGGVLLTGDAGAHIRHISLDSRTMKGDDLFVPVVGERVDAHDYICQAIETGAAAVFTSRHQSLEDVKAEIEKQCASHPEWRDAAEKAAWIYVENTKSGLQAYGSFCRSNNPIPLVGITGSVGKTTTREMVAAALSAGLKVYKTPGNSNSQVGVPITIAQIPEMAQIGVIELGMSEPGEMEKIAKVAQVNMAIVTNIGISHIEQLGSRENIRREKMNIQAGMPEDGILILNGDDDMLQNAEVTPGRKVLRYGFGENNDYRAENVSAENGYPVFTAVCGEKRVKVKLHVMGSHMILNALAALAAADQYGVSLEDAARTLEQFEGYRGRQQILKLSGITVIDDSYNASPASMKAGIEVLVSMPGNGRKIAVLADMKELGKEELRAHEEIGEYLKEHPVDFVLLYGKLAEKTGDRLKALGTSAAVLQMESLEDINRWLDEHAGSGDCILFKGSNSMGLSKAVAHMKEKRA